jgi:hypothetical protein
VCAAIARAAQPHFFINSLKVRHIHFYGQSDYSVKSSARSYIEAFRLKLIIIEASNSKDFFDNRLDGLLTQHLANLLNIKTKLLYALDDYHLGQAIKFAALSKSNVMHPSCHGDKHGIAVTDKNNIDWPSFVKLFDINKYSPQALVMSSCCAADNSLARAFRKVKARPDIIFGSTDERYYNEYAVAWTILYNLFRNKGVEQTVAQEALGCISAIVHPSFKYLRWDEDHQNYRGYPRADQRFEVKERVKRKS